MSERSRRIGAYVLGFIVFAGWQFGLAGLSTGAHWPDVIDRDDWGPACAAAAEGNVPSLAMTFLAKPVGGVLAWAFIRWVMKVRGGHGYLFAIVGGVSFVDASSPSMAASLGLVFVVIVFAMIDPERAKRMLSARTE